MDISRIASIIRDRLYRIRPYLAYTKRIMAGLKVWALNILKILRNSTLVKVSSPKATALLTA